MKKTIILIQLMILISFTSFSQGSGNKSSLVDDTKFFAALSGGPSIPVGVFQKKDFAVTSEAGLAKVGYVLNANLGYKFHNNFGIASTVFYSMYKLDQKAISDFIGKSTTTVVGATADHWQYVGVVAGPMATVPLMEKLFIDFKAMAGYAHANMPVIKVQLEGLPAPVNASQEKWADAFAWQLGTNLRYNLSSKFCLFGNADYNYMKPTWKTDVGDVVQKLGVVDINVGVGANF